MTSSHSLRNWLSHTASAGYIAKGVIYITVGWLALLTAAGFGGSESGTSDVIRQIALWPFGGFLLALLGLGLVAYVLWRLAQAIWDTERKGREWKGLLQRIGFAVSGSLYTALAWQCATLLFNSLSSGGGDQQGAQRLFSLPGGRWLLLATGAVFIAVGIHQLRRAWRRSYRKNWHLEDRPNPPLPLLEGIARLGLGARGVTFMLIGMLFGIAAWEVSPDDAKGLGAALNFLAHQPYGDVMLGAVAIGLIAYGGYCFINAGYRRVRHPR
ncbi:DUF1206 domain-containing protein [Salinicola avicenniae]|uniref:DUF1206 domain-containing protein n=1 Tax=Salinicola avicenniae TaxID=2916836 RepID=UPI00207461CE|nr:MULTISPECIES: DUF1206 domain-containing protein [unclassified Salinicola]